MTLVVIGVGLGAACCLANTGHQVTCVEADEAKLYDISVIAGHKKDSFTDEGAYYIHAPKYSSEHILTSIVYL